MMNDYPHVTIEMGTLKVSGTLKAVKTSRKKYLTLFSELTLKEKAGLNVKSVAQALEYDPEDAIEAAITGVGSAVVKAVVQAKTGSNLSHVHANNDAAKYFSSVVSNMKNNLMPTPKKLLTIDMSKLVKMERGSLIDRYVALYTESSCYKLSFGGVKQHFDFYKELCNEFDLN